MPEQDDQYCLVPDALNSLTGQNMHDKFYQPGIKIPN